MTHVLAIAAVAAAYVLFVAVRPQKRCGRCRGWGVKGRRRSQCPRCSGTGTRFWPGARLVHAALAAVARYLRARRQQS
jgi:hypothetical protein